MNISKIIDTLETDHRPRRFPVHAVALRSNNTTVDRPSAAYINDTRLLRNALRRHPSVRLPPTNVIRTLYKLQPHP